MAVKKISTVGIEIQDKPGALHKLLAKISSAKVDLACLAAFSGGAGRGKVYLGAKNTQALKTITQTSGLSTTEVAGFIIDGDDRIGAAAQALKGLADAGINGLAGAAMTCDGRYHMLVIVNAADSDTAEKALG